MPRYSTEIVVAADRYVCLQLPSDFPEGVASITVRFESSADHVPSEEDPDRDDIEWWDEFDEEHESES